MNRRVLALGIWALAVLSACGVDAAPVGDAGADGSTSVGCPSGQPSVGTACSSEGLQCSYSRQVCAGTWTCTSGRWQESLPGGACANDAGVQCHGTSDVIHRATAPACASNVGVDAGCGITPHDQCLTDGDCPSGQACLCQTLQCWPLGTDRGNVCIPAICHVDSDCAPCGVCQAESACGQILGFACQTPDDDCYPSTSLCGYVSGRWVFVTTGCPAAG